MFIYNTKENKNDICHHILDPDYVYNTYDERDTLYPYFKNLIIPNEVHFIVGIYIKYEILNINYQTHPQVYQKFSLPIQSKIQKYLDYGCANLFSNNANHYFLTMFNVEEDDVITSLIHLIENLKTKEFTYRDYHFQLQLKCGLYFSHPYIDPYQFYHNAKEQYLNIIDKPNTFISTQSYFLFE